MLNAGQKKSEFEVTLNEEPVIKQAIEDVQRDLEKEQRKYSFIFQKEYQYYI